MILRQLTLLVVCCVPLSGVVMLSGCGSAPPDVTPAPMTPEELEAYNKQNEAESRKVR